MLFPTALLVFWFSAAPAFSQVQPTAYRQPPTEYGYDLERALIKGGMIFVSGALDGLSETLIWHYPAFQRVHPNADPLYWNPYQSWRNKYRNGDPSQGAAFPGSTTWLAWSTDGYHASRTGSRFFLFGSITISVFEKKRKWWTYPAEFIAGGLIQIGRAHV
jgi:hypothetical protein